MARPALVAGPRNQLYLAEVNAKDPQQPAFEIRVRAAKHEPDMFYMNRCMRLVEDQLFG